MKISIVTISYNQSKYLELCLRSVIEQDQINKEYIVVDPGSTDGSREIIEKYKNYINKIIFETDKGPADGLNKGFSHATGDIYGFLNSDDLLLPGALKSVELAFSEMPRIDVVSGHAFVIDQNGERISKLYSRKYSLFRYVYGAATIAQQSTFFRSLAFKKTNGFNVQNRVYWDGELFFDLAMSGAQFAVLNKLLACFRIYGNSITGSQRLRDAAYQNNLRLFTQLYGREWKRRDLLTHYYAKILEYSQQPWILFERLRNGPTIPRKYRSNRWPG